MVIRQFAVLPNPSAKSRMLDLTSLANIERNLLRNVEGDLLDHEYDIRRALDQVFTGF